MESKNGYDYLVIIILGTILMSSLCYGLATMIGLIA